ncbi:unnamed protein product, partial [Ixodes persulcatus]
APRALAFFPLLLYAVLPLSSSLVPSESFSSRPKHNSFSSTVLGVVCRGSSSSPSNGEVVGVVVVAADGRCVIRCQRLERLVKLITHSSPTPQRQKTCFLTTCCSMKTDRTHRT